MNTLKQYFMKYFEQFFVLGILLASAGIYYFVEQRLAFLDFFFLPIILAGYYLGMRKAVLGAFLVNLMIFGYLIYDPARFLVRYDSVNMYLHFTVWGSFLLLSASVVGHQKERIEVSFTGIMALNKSLEEQQRELNHAHQSLKGYSENLESMVKVRTEELEASRKATEQLKEKVENALFSTIDSSVAKLIIEGRLRSDKRQISVMFADLVGFTSYSEDRSPEIVVRDVNAFLEKIEPVLSGFHGHLDKFMGDGIMCQFGAPINFDSYRLLAVMTALEMQDIMRMSAFPWEMRIGIASGAAITGLIGANRQSYTSIGDVVNVASRLEKKCTPGAIVIDDTTYDGCRDFVNAMPVNLEHLSPDELALQAEVADLEKLIAGSSIQGEQSRLLAQLGAAHVNLGDFDDGILAYERSILLNPANSVAKISLADAVIARQSQGQVRVKGRKKAVRAYSVYSLRDPFEDTNRVPDSVAKKFRPILRAIAIPDSVPLRVEALDGSVGHSKVVALLSYAIASRLSVFDRENQEIMLAGFTADLGKEIVPHHVLTTKGALTGSEMVEIHKHPTESVRILKKLGYNSPGLLEIVANTHEKLDGSGYPRGVKGENIPWGAKIVAVADAYAAMTSWRPYREKWDRTATIDELKKLATKGKYDIAIVEALESLLDQNAVIVTDPLVRSLAG